MKNKVSDKLESILLKLRIKEFTAEEIESKFSESEIFQLHNETTNFDNIKKNVKETSFNQSVYFVWLYYFHNMIINSGLKPENHTEEEEPQQIFLKSIISFFYNLGSLLKQSHFNPSIKIYFQNFDLDSIKNLDLVLLQSIFLDYNFVIQFSEIIKDSDEEVKIQFNDLKNELKAQLENAVNFWEETDIGKFKFKRAILNNGNKNHSQFYFTEEILKVLISSINNIKNINREILENTLTPDLIREVIELIEFFESYDYKNDTLKRLTYIFPDNSSLSMRKRKLIIHQILLFFNHPEAMTLIDDEVFLRKENSTIYSLEQTKVRIVDRVLGDLK